MQFNTANSLLFLPYFGCLTLTTAQAVGQIGDGQIQAPSAAAKVTPAPKAASASPMAPAPAPIVESAAVAPPTNHTLPPAPAKAPLPAQEHGMEETPAPNYPHPTLPSARVPLHTANSSISAYPSGTGIAAVAGNATAPTVPAVPSVVGGGAETGAAPTEAEGPREAGTSAPAVTTGAAGRVGGEEMGLFGVVIGVWVFAGLW